MMVTDTTLEKWEKLVQTQLKKKDIYSVLKTENLERIDIQPYYTDSHMRMANLPRVEESTQLVSLYSKELDDQAFAFLLKHNVAGLAEKVLYISNRELAEHISPEEDNRYISLIDVFNEDGSVDVNFAKELMAKDFERRICIDSAKFQNAGASVVQQLSLSLLKTKELTEIFGGEILEKLSFRFAVGSNYFLEISKIRAFKILFNQLSKEFGKDIFPYLFVETTLRNKTLADPENNLIRSTIELSAAMIAGSDAVFSQAYTLHEDNSLATEISFKQQIVLAYESIINVFSDASNGSYYVNNITKQICDKAWSDFIKSEEQGGYSYLMKQGFIQQQIYDQAVREQHKIETGEIPLIGANLYPKLSFRKSIDELYDASQIKAVRLSEMFE